MHMIVKGVLGFLLLGLLLFASAGTVYYTNAWVFLITLFTLMLVMGLVLLIKYPKTLERRLKSKESEASQKSYIALIGISFVASFALAGFDYRFGWSKMPFAVPAAGWIVMLIGYILYSAVIFQNAYASRVVEVQQDQVIISTGLYAMIRHPMYLAALLLFLSMPFVLGSYIALLPMLVFPVFLVLRIKNEEAILVSGLKGYSGYMQKTRFRLIPYIW